MQAVNSTVRDFFGFFWNYQQIC